MAVLPANLYRNFMLTQSGMQFVPGLAAAHGAAANLANWNALPALGGEEETKVYYVSGAAMGADAFTLSGGATIWNAAAGLSLPWIDDAETDDPSNDSTYPPIYNPLFSGAWVNESTNIRYTYTISVVCTTNYSGYLRPNFDLRLYLYTQAPDDATGTARESWVYSDAAGFSWGRLRSTLDESSKYTLVKIYNLYIGDKEFYMLAFGVSADNEYYTEQGSEFISHFVAIPKILFMDKEVRPWVGETSNDDSETAFASPDGGEWHDAITTRTNYDVNPYGVNQRGGIKVIFPTVSSDGTIYPLALQFIINGIYRGYSENVLNQLGQAIADITGGNASRPAEEVQAILSAILSIHSVPVIYPTGTPGSYAQEQTRFNTISGYDITGIYLPLTSPGQKTIFEWVYTTDVIARRLNCFLDFEPFTTITLKLPFFPPVSLAPSAVFGHRLQVDYKIDILTGLLSADVSTTGDDGTYYILTTLQGSVKTAIPIMGQGAQNAVLEKITGAIVSASKYGAIVGGAAGAFSVYNEIAQSGHGVAVGDMSVDGLGAYLSPRAAYLICTHPVAAIPASYDAQGAIVGDFLDNIGMAANLGGKVGDFAGGFASFSAVDLSGFEATDAEKAAIMALLKGGVYL